MTSDVVPDELPADIDDPRDERPDSRKRRILRLSTLPAALTLGNMVCGVLAIAYAGDASGFYAAGDAAAAAGRIEAAGWLILLGMVFDGFDGRVARLVRSNPDFGGALDSLADVVTFGVAPALVAKAIMEGSLGFQEPKMTFLTVAFYAVCACLRLARYNAEHEESTKAVTHFSGLPTPGAAGVVAGAAMVHAQILGWLEPGLEWRMVLAHVVGFGMMTGLGLLMVSRVPYLHFANRFLRGRKPVGRLALIFLVMMLALNFDLAMVFAVGFTAYALLGPVAMLPRVLFGRREEITELFD
jgi:CDP-diacylglycerol--serine O-phosphatidyltransferase